MVLCKIFKTCWILTKYRTYSEFIWLTVVSVEGEVYVRGLSRSDINMFAVLEDQDGGSHSGSGSESDSPESDMLLSGDDFQEEKS